MNHETTSLSDDLRRYGLLLRRWAWLMVLASGLAAGAAYLVCWRMAPVYQANALALVSEAPNDQANDYTTVMDRERLARTYARLMTTRPVLEGAAKRLNLATPLEDLAEAVQVEPVSETPLIQVSVEDKDPDRAAAIANAIVAEFIQQNPAEQASPSVVQKELAGPPEKPVRPRTWLYTLLGGAVGLMLAMGAAFLVEALDDTLQGPDDVTGKLGLPVLGVIARHKPKDGRLVTVSQPRSPVSGSFQALRINLRFACPNRPLRTLLVTSPGIGDGKSTVSANLGAVMAQAGSRVLLVDGNLHRPRLHQYLSLSNLNGVRTLVWQAVMRREELRRDGHFQDTGISGLRVVTAGEPTSNPAEVLILEKMGEALDSLQSEADLVIIDSPPVLDGADAAMLAPCFDGVLLVLRPGKTRLTDCRLAVEQLRRTRANLLGVVLNDLPAGRSG